MIGRAKPQAFLHYLKSRRMLLGVPGAQQSGRIEVLAISLDCAQMAFAPGWDAQDSICVGRKGLPVSFEVVERPPLDWSDNSRQGSECPFLSGRLLTRIM